MEKIIFIIFILLIVALAVNNGRKAAKLAELRMTEELKNSYGKKINPKEAGKDVELNVAGYYEYYKKHHVHEFFIDDITWNDLNLGTFFNVVNSTLSSAGEAVLFSKFHALSMDNETPEAFYDEVTKISEDGKSRLEIQKKLSKLGKLKGIDAFDVLTGLFDAKPRSVCLDFMMIVGLVISFVIIFVKPAIGFLLFLAMLLVAISSYFKGKAEMEINIRAFRYVLKLIRCANDINVVIPGKCSLNDELSGLIRYSFLIPKTDGTTSNPLSIIWDYVRMIFHIDLIVYNHRLSEVIHNSENIIKLFEEIGCTDAQIAVASYINSIPKHCRPDYAAKGLRVYKAEGLYHPLTSRQVYNDVDAGRGVLITGSNASGKSTFLKMVGISVITAQSMGFALADRLEISPFCLYSSMALSDNIVGEESYYVVESKSLKRICDASRGCDNIMCIVDEVLRGTNTSERIAASDAIMRYLQDAGVLCFVATHDTELTQLLAERFELYFFSEKVDNGNVTFPYLIQKGVSEAGNAIKLLEILGYPDSVILQANNLTKYHRDSGKWVNN